MFNLNSAILFKFLAKRLVMNTIISSTFLYLINIYSYSRDHQIFIISHLSDREGYERKYYIKPVVYHT
jgi:hypothetical protein